MALCLQPLWDRKSETGGCSGEGRLGMSKNKNINEKTKKQIHNCVDLPPECFRFGF